MCASVASLRTVGLVVLPVLGLLVTLGDVELFQGVRSGLHPAHAGTIKAPMDLRSVGLTDDPFAEEYEELVDGDSHAPALSPPPPSTGVTPAPRRQPRPRGLRLIFLGDSITRYQYLSLAYFLATGEWYEPAEDAADRLSSGTRPAQGDNDGGEDVPRRGTAPAPSHNLMYSHSYHDPAHPHEDWQRFFRGSNRRLRRRELCDCARDAAGAVSVERRYFWDYAAPTTTGRRRDNRLVYINLSGHEGTGARTGIYGRVDPRRVFRDPAAFARHAGLLPFGDGGGGGEPGRDQTVSRSGYGTTGTGRVLRRPQRSDGDDAATEPPLAKEWEYASWDDLVRHHLAALDLGEDRAISGSGSAPAPVVVLLNAGLHAHEFPAAGPALVEALNETGLRGIWKTTTYYRDDLHNRTATYIRPHDTAMCSLMPRCLNLSWTSHLDPLLYIDRQHFQEPVYRIINEDLLDMLGLLPGNYTRMDRRLVLQRPGVRI